MRSRKKRWIACILVCILVTGAVGTVKNVAADDKMQYNLSEIDVEGYSDWQIANAVTDEIAPVYQPSYQMDGRTVKLKIKDDGLLNIELSTWKDGKKVPQTAVYDRNNKLLGKTWNHYESQYYIKTYVKAGDVFYVKLPQTKWPFRIQAAVLKNASSIKSEMDPVTILGEGKKCYRTFHLKKKSVVGFEYDSLVYAGGSVSVRVQKRSGKTWKNTGAAMRKQAKTGEYIYGLRKGTYRLVFEMPRTQAVIFSYDTMPSFYNGKYGLKKSTAKNLKKAEGYQSYSADQMFTKEAQKSRWYRYKKKSKKAGFLYLTANGNDGKVKFTVYKAGKKKAWKTFSFINDTKKHRLPKGKQTYYIKVSKKGKKTNGYYDISTE
ncbi:hypothetical protein [Anaerostipes caccae]|uniref:hypothetical protein n=1 Tax=Anaerostipes caccae TaxID=105841 RepID=UPI0038D45E02